MSSSKFINVNPAVGIDVNFWAIDDTITELKKDDGDKVKNFEMHPSKPWVISVDRDDEIYIWDLSKKTKIFQKSLSSIMSIDNTNRTKDDQPIKNMFTTSSLNYRKASLFKYYKSDNYDKLILGKKSMTNSILHDTNPSNVNDATSIYVKAVSFIDLESIHTNYTCQQHLIESSSSSFHTTTKIMILTSISILFYDLNTNITESITTQDLNNKIPTAVEFLTDAILSIGCSDGCIRIYDCMKKVELKVLQGHNKGDIMMVKTLPILIRKNNNYERYVPTVTHTSSGSVIKESRIRLLSMGVDGTIFIWDGAITGNIIQIHTKQPHIRLENSGPTNIVVCQSIFIDELTNELYTLSADSIIRVWDLDQIPSSTHSTTTSTNTTATTVLSSSVSTPSMKAASSSSYGFTSSSSSSSSNTPMTSIGKNITRRSTTTGGGGGGAGGGASNGFLDTLQESNTTNTTTTNMTNMNTNIATVMLNKSIYCHEKYKLSSSFPHNMSKLTSIKPIFHPKYPPGTFVGVSKNNMIALLQTFDESVSTMTTDSTVSGLPGSTHTAGISTRRFSNMMDNSTDSASVMSSTTTANTTTTAMKKDKDKAKKIETPLCLLNLNTLMAGYVQKLKNLPALPLIASAIDIQVKIYKIHTSILYPQLMIIATSIGIITLHICPTQVMCPYVGKHLNWNNQFLQYHHTDVTMNKIHWEYSGASDINHTNDANQNRITTTTSSSQNITQHSDVDDSMNTPRTIKSGNIITPFNPEIQTISSHYYHSNNNNDDIEGSYVPDTIQLQVTSNMKLLQNKGDAKSHLIANKVKSGFFKSNKSTSTTTTTPPTTVAGISTNSNNSSNSGVNNTNANAKTIINHIEIMTTRPQVYIHPSGVLCAFVWPDSQVYMIVSVPSSLHVENSSISSSVMLQSLSSISASSHVLSALSDTTHGTPGSTSTTAEMIEIDRGTCLSFAWITTSTTTSSTATNNITTTQAEYIYSILCPGKRIINIVKNKRSLGILTKTEEETVGDFVPPTIQYKKLMITYTSTSTSNTYGNTVNPPSQTSSPTKLTSGGVSSSSLGLDSIQSVTTIDLHVILPKDHNISSPHILYGGPILCISSLLKSHTNGALAKKPPTIEELSQETKEKSYKLNSTVLNTISQNLYTSYTLYEESIGGSYDIIQHTNKCQFYNFKMIVSSNVNEIQNIYELVPVGPCMPHIQAIQWEYSSGLCAVLIHTRINILSIVPTQQINPSSKIPSSTPDLFSTTTMTLLTLTSVDLSSHIYDMPSSMTWQRGILYVTTSKLITMICTGHPHINSLSSKHGNTDLSTTLSSNMTEIIHIATSNKSWNNPTRCTTDISSYYPRPVGGWECIGIDRYKLILASRYHDILTYVPLYSNPLAVIHLLLSEYTPLEKAPTISTATSSISPIGPPLNKPLSTSIKYEDPLDLLLSWINLLPTPALQEKYITTLLQYNILSKNVCMSLLQCPLQVGIQVSQVTHNQDTKSQLLEAIHPY